MLMLEDIVTILEGMGYKVLYPVVKPYLFFETLFIFKPSQDGQFVKWSFSVELLRQDRETVIKQILTVLMHFAPPTNRRIKWEQQQ